MINYCESLKPKEEQKVEEKQGKTNEEVEIKGKEWEKELKKGAQLIVGKKQKNDDEEVKPKKEKKKKQKNEE